MREPSGPQRSSPRSPHLLCEHLWNFRLLTRFFPAMASDLESLFYCYNCERTVVLESPDSLVCAECHSDFIEENTNWTSATEHATSASGVTANEIDYMGTGFGQLLEDMSSFLSHVRVAGVDNEDAPRILRLGTDAHALNPILLLQGRIQNLLNLHEGDHVVDDVAVLHIPGTIGDYFVGPGLENFIQELRENDPSKCGSPPASKSAVDDLPTITISSKHLQGTDAARCAVCKEGFLLLSQVKQLPCDHIYHPDCILPWLEQHNSCPICRYELPTDDPDYERSRAQRISVGQFSPNTVGHTIHRDQNVQDASVFQNFPRQSVVTSEPVEDHHASEQQSSLLSSGGDNTQVDIAMGSDGNAGTEHCFSMLSPRHQSVAAHSLIRADLLREIQNVSTISSESLSDRDAPCDQTPRGLLASDNDGDSPMLKRLEEELD